MRTKLIMILSGLLAASFLTLPQAQATSINPNSPLCDAAKVRATTMSATDGTYKASVVYGTVASGDIDFAQWNCVAQTPATSLNYTIEQGPQGGNVDSNISGSTMHYHWLSLEQKNWDVVIRVDALNANNDVLATNHVSFQLITQICTSTGITGTGEVQHPFQYNAGHGVKDLAKTISLQSLNCLAGTTATTSTTTHGTAVIKNSAFADETPLVVLTPNDGDNANPVALTTTLTVTHGTLTQEIAVSLDSYASTTTTRPVCTDFTVSTFKNTPVSINPFTLGACSDADSLSTDLRVMPIAVTDSDPLKVSPRRGTVKPGANSKTLTFTPKYNYLTPSDQVSDRAQFIIQVRDELGNAIKNVTVIVNVNAKSGRSSACKSFEAPRGALFNDPTASASDDRKLGTGRFAITNAIIKMIDCAQPGSVIAMSWFSITDDNLANHLIQAYKDGVNVRLLINSHSANTQTFKTLQRNIKTSPKKANVNGSTGSGSWVSYCDRGCLTPMAPKGLEFPADISGNPQEAEYPALHAKFFLFTHTGQSEYVSGVASSNPTYEQAKRGFNNAYIYVGRLNKSKSAKTKLYMSLSNYFTDLGRSACTDRKISSCAYPKKWKAVAPKTARVIESDVDTTHYRAFPRANTASSSDSDDVTQLLNGVTCKYVDINGKAQRTKIYVNMFVFTRNSPAMKLWRLANGYGKDGRLGGCEVHVMYTDMDSRIKGTNTRNGAFTYLPAPNGKISNWGAADCMSTNPIQFYGKHNNKKKVRKLTGPGLAWSSTLNRVVHQDVCNQGSLQGLAPTINFNSGNYCWKHTKNSLNGGTLDMCVTTPLRVNVNDTADARAKLEAAFDSNEKKWYSHQKYILIDGQVDGVVKKLVVAGNTNLSVPALRWNDEIMTFIEKDTVFQQYLDNYNYMLTKVRHRAGPNRCLSMGLQARIDSQNCSVPYVGSW